MSGAQKTQALDAHIKEVANAAQDKKPEAPKPATGPVTQQPAQAANGKPAQPVVDASKQPPIQQPVAAKP